MTELERRIATLERLVRILLYISMENEDFWPYTTSEEQEVARNFTGKI